MRFGRGESDGERTSFHGHVDRTAIRQKSVPCKFWASVRRLAVTTTLAHCVDHVGVAERWCPQRWPRGLIKRDPASIIPIRSADQFQIVIVRLAVMSSTQILQAYFADLQPRACRFYVRADPTTASS